MSNADKNVSDAFRDLVNRVQSEQQFNVEVKAGMASDPDGWFVAYAKMNGFIIVTHEEYPPDAKRKVPIPNRCPEFEVDDFNTYEMLQDLNVQFILRRKHKR